MASLVFFCNLSSLSSILFISLLLLYTSCVVESNFTMSSYIVFTIETSRPSNFQTQGEWHSSMISSLTNQSDSRIFCGYDVVFKGFAAQLTTQEAKQIKEMPGVSAVIEDSVKTVLRTTRAPQFLGLNENYGLWPEARFGDDIIIGLVDTGIWPESISFNDEGLRPILDWRGSCEFESSLCNNKLIGAKVFTAGYQHFVANNLVEGLGGTRFILLNPANLGEGLMAKAFILPTASVGFNEGLGIRNYISTKANPTASFIFSNDTAVGNVRAPVVVAFSSRGSNPTVPEILKDDLIAPGFNILGVFPPNILPTFSSKDLRRAYFNIMSGISMACLRVAGAAALLLAVHSDWSPTAIRLTLMTTVGITDNERIPIARYEDMQRPHLMSEQGILFQSWLLIPG